MKIGDRVSNYKLLKELPKRGKNRYFECECINCGSVKPVARSTLYQKGKYFGHCQDCDVCSHYLYSTWKSMLTRCLNKNSSGYKNYGEKGIKVCDEWAESFWAFYRDMGDRPRGKTLDRIDNKGGYSKDNCRWATHKEQSRNTSRNVLIPYDGVLVTEADLAKIFNVNRSSVQARRNRGITIAEELVRGLRTI